MEYEFPVTIVETSEDDLLVSIFERIKSYGRRLSEQEQRQVGLVGSFSRLVRQISCEVRGDVSEDVIPFANMPKISAQGTKITHGYGIKAENTFWSAQGIIHFSSLRDSLDEQLVADIVACILKGTPI